MKPSARSLLLTASVLTLLIVAGALHRRISSGPSPAVAPESGPAASQISEVRHARPLPAIPPLVAADPGPGTPNPTAPRTGLAGTLLLPPAQDHVPGTKWKSPPTPSPVTRTSELILFLAPGADAEAVARDHGLQTRYRLAIDQPAWVFQARSPGAADKARSAAAQDPRVVSAFPNRKIRPVKHGFVPNDPYYPAGSPAGFPGQWHLVDAQLQGAWSRDLTGAGVVLGILDDGLEFTHPDLAGNFSAADSLNFGSTPPDNSYGPDISKDASDGGQDRHGTCVGGVAAAVGGNGLGVTGAAPKAGLAINRLTFDGSMTDANLLSAVLYHASGGNTTIKVKNHSYGYGVSYIENTSESGAVATSTSAGTLHVYSAGNSRLSSFGSWMVDSNTTMPQNSPDVITVAAVGKDTKYSYYSSFGANVLVTAPSSSDTVGVTTTDRVGAPGYSPFIYRPSPPSFPGEPDPFPDPNYTSQFGGTSSAAPLVTGIMALGKQANPALTVRLAQHCLVRSSDIVDPFDSSPVGGGDNLTPGSAWIANKAGRKFNLNYGFGRVNADKFVQEAVKYTGVTALQTETHSMTFPSPLAIPDNDATGLSQTFVVPPTTTTPLESVLVTLNIGSFASPHTYAGDLEAFLISPGPNPTVSRLMLHNLDAFGTYPDPGWTLPAWTFLTNAFWGENPTGTWTIKVTDRFAQDTGSWYGFSVVLRMGTPILDTTPPAVASITRVGANPTASNPILFKVKFSEYVTGVDVSDFQLVTTGTIAGAAITGITGGGDTYVVSVNPGSGMGTIQLNLIDNDSIADGNGNLLGGAGAGNGTFTTGEAFTVDLVPPFVSVTSTSLDGLYVKGATVDVTLQFSKAVTLAGGNLRVQLDSGGLLTILPFANRTSVSVPYTVATAEQSLDLTVQSLSLTGGTLRDATSNDVTLAIDPTLNLAYAHAILVDALPPSNGLVLDGLIGGDLSTQTSLTTINAHWSGFTDAVSGISGYRWAIGTAGGLGNVMPFTTVGLATSASTSALNVNLTLTPGTTYFVTVEAADLAGNKSIAASDGVQVIGGAATPPQPPGRMDALAQSSAVQLVWIPSPSIAVSAYRLWWKPSTLPWFAATLVDNVPGTTTTVSGLIIGTSYDFQLRALTPAGNESSSVYATGIPANTITVNGSGSYGSIQEAIDAAVPGDVVYVQAGTYPVNLTLPDGVSLAGISPRLTILAAANGAADVITATGTTTPSTISMLTVTGGQVGINAGIAPLTLRNLVIHHAASHGASSQAGSVLQVLNCTIAHNGGSGVAALGTTTVRNGIATGNALFGFSAPAASAVTYTDSYANTGGSFSAGLVLSTDYTTPAMFSDEPGNDYTELTGSFSIDTGDPLDAFSMEPSYNGGRINLGAFGNTPWAAISPPPPAPSGGGGGGGGGCGLLGIEGLLVMEFARRRRGPVLPPTSRRPIPD